MFAVSFNSFIVQPKICGLMRPKQSFPNIRSRPAAGWRQQGTEELPVTSNQYPPKTILILEIVGSILLFNKWKIQNIFK